MASSGILWIDLTFDFCVHLLFAVGRYLGISYEEDPTYRDFREGDVRHSEASISKAQSELGYHPEYTLKTGLNDCIDWYVHNLKKFNP